MTNTEVSDFLEHHGILGMKWGHRKNRDRVDTRPQRSSGIHNKPPMSNRQKNALARDKKKLKRAAIGIGVYAGLRYGTMPAIRAGRNFLAKNPQFYTRPAKMAALTSSPNYAQGFKFVSGVLRNGSKVRVLIPKI